MKGCLGPLNHLFDRKKVILKKINISSGIYLPVF